MMRVGLLVLVAACSSHTIGPMDRDAAAKLFDEITIDAPAGMSDLAIDDRGVLWGVAERDHTLVEIDNRTSPPTVVRHRLTGIAAGFETEALVWLGADTFALGLENGEAPGAAIAVAERRGDAFVVTSTRALTAPDLGGVAPTKNHGVEAGCGRVGELLFAGEEAGRFSDGRRWAPLVRVRGDALHVTRLALTTKTGKISALSCTIAEDGTAQVFAFERHFNVARILTFSVARYTTEVTPTLWLELGDVLHNAYNIEGLTRLPDGRLVAINDNQNSNAVGPTKLFVFHPR